MLEIVRKTSVSCLRLSRIAMIAFVGLLLAGACGRHKAPEIYSRIEVLTETDPDSAWNLYCSIPKESVAARDTFLHTLVGHEVKAHKHTLRIL